MIEVQPLPLTGKTVLVILRHANSLRVVQDYVTAQGGTSRAVALDPIEAHTLVAAALAEIRAAISAVDIIVAGTKVYDTVKDGPSRLFELLDILKQAGAGVKPICLTHLHGFTEETRAALQASPLRLSWCETDNLKRDSMTNLGPLLVQAALLA